MKINRIQWSMIKTRWDITKAKLAYVLADQEAATQEYLDLNVTLDDITTPDLFDKDADALLKAERIDYLIDRLEGVKKQADAALEREQYESLISLKQLYDVIQRKINQLTK